MWKWTNRLLLLGLVAIVTLQVVLHGPRMVAFYYWTVADRMDIARSWQEASLEINEHGGWFASETLAWDLFNLADLYDRIGEHDRIEPLLQRAQAHVLETHDRNHRAFAFIQGKFGNWHFKHGRYAQAEQRYKAALEIWEQYFSAAGGGRQVSTMESAWLEVGRRYLGESNAFWRRMYLWWETALPFDGMRGWVDILSNMASLYEVTERREEAWRLYSRAAELDARIRPPDHPNKAFHFNRSAVRHHNAGRYEAALGDYGKALAILRLNFGAQAVNVVNLELNIARVKQHMGREDGVEAALKRVLQIREQRLAPQHLDIAFARQSLAEYHQAKQRHRQALAYLRPALRTYVKVLGNDHPSTVIARTRLAQIHMAAGRDEPALKAARRAFRALLKRRPSQSGFERARGRDPVHLRSAIETYILAAYRVRRNKPGGSRKLKRASFIAAQAFQNQGAAAALNQLTVRASAEDDRLAGMIRQGQDEAARWRKLDSELTRALQDPRLAQNTQHIADLRAALKRSEAATGELDARLKREHPAFVDLSRPTPMSIREVQRVLRKDELLVRFISFHWYTMIWAVSPDQSLWTHVDIKERDLGDAIDALRCGLDPKSWHGEAAAQRCFDLTGEIWDAQQGEAMPFPRDRAAQLFEKLFGPLRKIMPGRKLILVPSGRLASLPFQVLVDRNGDDAASVNAWLGVRHAITVLPSVSALKGLRRQIVASKADRGFFGVGNPDLAGHGGCPVIQVPTSCAPGERTRAAQLDRSLLRAHLDTGAVYQNERVNLAAVRAMCPLQDSGYELKCVARSFADRRSQLLLGASASEAGIKRLSRSGELARYRVIHFATHGLLANEVSTMGGRFAEPALVLTPPDARSGTPAAGDDGLLTSSEISALRLDADWVIMSACNTAASGRDGGEPLSGLATAFFYAGARSLLVSHWPVNSAAAVALTTGAFSALRADPGIGRAEALRRSIATLVERGGAWSQPAVWAPFFVVGEGGAAVATDR